MMIDFLRDLLGHSEWANAVFFHAWGKSPAREHEEMRQRIRHLLGVQAGFLAVLRGETPGHPTDEPPPDYATLKARAEAGHAGLREFAGNLDMVEVGRTVPHSLVPGAAVRDPRR